MADKSDSQSNYSSDSSSSDSDHAADPDYSVRRSRRLREQSSNLSLFEQYQKLLEKEGDDGGGGSRGKRGRPSKEEELGLGELQSIQIPRRARAKRKRASWDAQGCRASGNKNTENESDNENDQRKTKITILSWLIDTNTVRESAQVCYMCETDGRARKKGVIMREGILCSCCNEVFTAMGFEAHAGSSLGKPYENIFIAETHDSLFSCMIQAWNQPEESANRRFNAIDGTKYGASDSHDDACIICADGGNLICCDKCNSTYHQACMGMKTLPLDSWYCPYCVCKFCGELCPEDDYLLTCSQCEKQYHWECFQDKEPLVIDVNSTPSPPFCEKGCREVYEKLEKLVGEENELDEGFTWTLVRQMDQQFGVCENDLHRRTHCHSKLAIAWNLMKECFETIVDRHTRINIIQSVVYNCGSNFNRINFRSFYTAVLEKDNEIISAASLRIHGTKLAEIPFIATREMHRGKGMCRKLMTAIESALCYFKVENLIIPSITERIGNWVESYGFHIMDTKLRDDIVDFNTLMFHDSVRLQKILCSPIATELPNASTNGAMESKSRSNDEQIGVDFRNKTRTWACFDLNKKAEPPEEEDEKDMTKIEHIE